MLGMYEASLVGWFEWPVRPKWVVSQPEPIARCVWKSTVVVLGGTDNHDLPGARLERF